METDGEHDEPKFINSHVPVLLCHIYDDSMYEYAKADLKIRSKRHTVQVKKTEK